MAVVVAISLLAVLLAVFLVAVLAKNGGRKAVGWAVLLVVAVPVTLVALSLALIFYDAPLWAWAAVGACAIGVGVLFVLLGRSVHWKARPVAAAAALLLIATVLGTAFLMAVPLAPAPLLEARAQQIAEANDFAALLAPDEALLSSSGLPVNALPEPDGGLSVEYERFLLQERKADGPLTAEDLAALVAPGATPIRDRQPLPDDVVTGSQTVHGNPAIGADYVDVPPEAADKPGEGEHTTLLAFGSDRVEVILWSTTWYDCTPPGSARRCPR